MFYSAALCLFSVLLLHKKQNMFFAAGAAAVIGVYLVSFDIYRALICLFGTLCAYLFVFLSEKKRFTCSGYMNLCAVMYGVSFVGMIAVLCFEKYGAFNIDTLISAYDAVGGLLKSAPLEMIEILRENGSEQFESMIEQYTVMAELTEKMFDLLLYVIPAFFLSICALLGFITVNTARAQKQMQGEEDVYGEFSISLVSAVIYLIVNLIGIFADPYTPFGVTLAAVSMPLELALAYVGLRFGILILKKTKKGAAYYVVPIIIAAVMPSVFITLLAYLGAYKSIFYELVRGVVIIRKKDDGNDSDDDREDR
jgi:hypothetical protein